MKLEYQSRWLRLLIELFPTLPGIRRYRVAPARLEGDTARLLRRRIARRLQTPDREHSPG